MFSVKTLTNFTRDITFITSSIPSFLRGQWHRAIAWICVLPLLDIISAYWLYILVMILQGEHIIIKGFTFNRDNFTGVIIILGLLTALRQLAEYFSVKITRHFTQRVFQHFSMKLTEKYMTMPWLSFSSDNRSARIKHVTDTSLNYSYSFQIVLNVISALCTFLFIGAAVLIQMPLLILGIGITLIISSLLSGKYLKPKLYSASDRHELYQKKFYQHIYELFNFNREINVYKARKFFLKQTRNTQEALSKAKVELSILPHIPRLILELAITLSLTGIMLFIFLTNTYSSQQLIASLATIAVLTRRILPSISMFLSANTELYGSRMNAQIIQEESGSSTDQEPALQKADLPANVLIRLTDVDFGYTTGNIIIHHFTFDFMAGDSVAIVGETGKGKSSLLMMAGGILQPVSGSISYSQRLTDNEKAITYVAQEVYLLNDSVLSNICFANEQVNEHRAWEVLKMVKLDDFIMSLPDGMYTTIGDNGNSFSGGQRQRLSIARALYQQPQVLLLDEATSALDEATEKEVMTNILKCMSSGAVVFITHRNQTAEVFSNKTIEL